MMIFSLVLGMLFGGFSVIFALQNSDVISVMFFDWEIVGSLSIILLLTLVMGIITTLLVLAPETIKNYFRYKKLLKENARLEEELRKQRELTVFARSTPSDPATITHIEQSSIKPFGAI